MKKAVSVIIPVYNAEKYLRECIDSVLVQSFKEFEIILVNDGSVDRSGFIINQYAEKYPGIIRTIHQKNKGQSAARNAALDIAEGKYLVFVDSDDYIGSNYIEELYVKAEATDSDMVICNYTKVTDTGRIIKEYEANFVEKGTRIPSYLSCNRIIRRSIVEEYKIRYQSGNVCEDIPFILMLEEIAENIQIISNAGYYYRTNPVSTTSTFKKNITFEKLPFKAMEKCVNFCSEHGKNLSREELEFFVCRIWTTLIFDIGRGCDPQVRKKMCRRVEIFMRKYFPEYYKNPYVKPGAFSSMSAVQKWGTWFFVHTMHWHLLQPFAWLCSLV